MMGTAILLLPLSLLAQETGNLQIKCEPGVKVFLDGVSRGESTAEQEGLVIPNVPAGRHMLRLLWNDSSTQEGEIRVIAGQTNLIQVGRSGQIVVKGEAGVKIFLDGIFAGETDAAKGGLPIESVSIGPHKIKAVKEGFPPQEAELDLKEGRIFFSLKPFSRGSQTPEKAAPPEAGPKERENSLGMRLRLVPPGEVEMDLPEGSVGGEAESVKALQLGPPARNAKKPLARIPRAFEISLCEVKMSDFEKVLGRKPKAAATDFRLERLGKPYPNLPAMSVSWEEAVEFSKKLTELPAEKEAGTRYRLPTEAEWALARETAGPQSPGFPCFPWAERKIPKSIWELCSNFYDAAYYKNMPPLDPQGPSSGSRRVARLVYGDPAAPFSWCTFRVVAEGRHLEDWVRKKSKVDDYEKGVREGAREPSPIELGLRWLALHQDPDGRWSTQYFNSHCPEGSKCSGPGHGDRDVGITGLALLAFLGRGGSPASDYIFEDPRNPGVTLSFNDAVEKGIHWLASLQDREGSFMKQDRQFMYEHAIAAQAMVRGAMVPGLEGFKGHAQKGIDFLVRAQNPGYAWRYDVRKGDNDTSVTGWCVMALKSAELSGLKFNHQAYQGVKAWLDRMTNIKTGVVGYISPGDTGSVIHGFNEKWQTHPVMTSVGLLSRLYAEKKPADPWLKVAAGIIVKDLPVWDESNQTVDSYYWHYATLALRELEGPNGHAWKTFRDAVRKALLPSQGGKATCAGGSWDPRVDKWGLEAGRVYTTAINLLTLEAAEMSGKK